MQARKNLSYEYKFKKKKKHLDTRKQREKQGAPEK